jgi:broad specificity phosphatase PhoE
VTESRILLIRHPETEANVVGRFVGRGDSPYTAEGRKQYSRLIRRIVGFRPATLWSSPLTRAVRVAEKAAADAGLELRIDDRLLELDFGTAEGLTFDDISAAAMPFNYADREHPVAPGGESRASIESRTIDILDEIVGVGGRHAIVTHGGVFRAGLVHLLGLDSDDIWAFHIHNAQLATVRVVDGHGMLEEYVQG